MKLYKKVMLEMFDTPVINGRVAQELSILKGYIYASIFVIAFSPFRGIIIKESTDSERNWSFLHILDNILYIFVFFGIYLIIRLIKNENIKRKVVLIYAVCVSVIVMEMSIYLKADHRACIEM